MKKILLLSFTLCTLFAKAQVVENIYVNLYTDSLKKGTLNYINIDGLLSNGKYLPLDSSHLIFWASSGNFSGNSLWIDRDFAAEKVDVKVTLRSNPALIKEFTIYIKKKPDPELKTLDELKIIQKPDGVKNNYDHINKMPGESGRFAGLFVMV